jgi:hypothetical protein
MFRFTIRDVLWLTVVVALGSVWYLERDGSASLRSAAERLHRENEELRKDLKLSKKQADLYKTQNEMILRITGAHGP